ncbi:hypothetical protein GCM10009534_68920 [Kribbella sandramycini]
MFGFSAVNAVAISCMAGVWVPAQIPYVMVTGPSDSDDPLPLEHPASSAATATIAGASNVFLVICFLSSQ